MVERRKKTPRVGVARASLSIPRRAPLFVRLTSLISLPVPSLFVYRTPPSLLVSSGSPFITRYRETRSSRPRRGGTTWRSSSRERTLVSYVLIRPADSTSHIPGRNDISARTRAPLDANLREPLSDQSTAPCAFRPYRRRGGDRPLRPIIMLVFTSSLRRRPSEGSTDRSLLSSVSSRERGPARVDASRSRVRTSPARRTSPSLLSSGLIALFSSDISNVASIGASREKRGRQVGR